MLRPYRDGVINVGHTKEGSHTSHTQFLLLLGVARQCEVILVLESLLDLFQAVI